MSDDDVREILTGTLEAVKTQMIYVSNLHDAFSALYDAVMRLHPQAKQFDEEETKKIRLNVVQQSQLDAIDVLLAKLGKPQSL